MKRRNSFQTRIAGVLILLLLVVIGSLYFAVKAATADAVKKQASQQLEVGVRVFERLLDVRSRQIRDAVQVLSSDFGFKDAVASDDTATISSVLGNHGKRIDATEVLLLALDGTIKATATASNGPDAFTPGIAFRYSRELAEARRNKQSALIVSINHEPHLLVEAQVLAPIAIARVVMGFRMDDALASELRSLTNLDVSFLAIENNTPGRLISTLSADQESAMANNLQLEKTTTLKEFEFAGQRYLNEQLVLATGSNYQVQAYLHSSLDQALVAFKPLDRRVLVIALCALLASLVGALFLARSISRPVRELARVAERVGQGDYQGDIDLKRSDELGVLAKTFQQMQTDLAERERQLAHNALHDSLTGLPNRTLAVERLGSSIMAERPMALLNLGIANFRSVNETCGPGGGDLALQQISRRLQATLRPGDSLARLLADEFLVMLDGSDRDSAVAAADHLQQLLIKPLRVGNHDIALDCCIGIAAYPQDGVTPDELLRRANLAMNDAARQPGRLQVYQQGREDDHERQINLIRDLRRAAEGGELVLHYQPKLNINEGHVRQAEALLRWQHPHYGLVSPGEFIPLAERTGSIQALTAWVIEEVLRQLREWNGRGLRVLMSLNISAEDLHDIGLATRVSRLLAQYAVPAEQLIFEITESAVMQNPETALKVLHSLRACGISLSVDDFGTGYSSLAQLKRMPVQELKIDQSFVRDLDDASEDSVIVRSTIEMSHSLGLKVVAEGVEFERCLRLLEKWNCDTAQGYLISRPLTALAFEAWVTQPLRANLAMLH
ncbi:MAG: EAL domain-containing protein [Pseudomonas sp.]|uniref:bifunctional diguanylate cyclase/phosphodiesterase n=1 Tax=Pseudomonas sp. TaxID=306 RepID=UPI0030F2EE0E